jgi:hypothetical protein
MPIITSNKILQIPEGFIDSFDDFNVPDETLQTEVQNPLSVESANYVSVRRFWQGINYFLGQSWTWALKQIFQVAPRFNSVNANLPLKVDTNKELVSGQIITADVADKAVTRQKLEDFPAFSILRNSTNATATPNFEVFLADEEFIAPPATSTSTGLQGQKAYNNTHFFVCVQDNFWIKIARDLSVW